MWPPWTKWFLHKLFYGFGSFVKVALTHSTKCFRKVIVVLVVNSKSLIASPIVLLAGKMLSDSVS